MKAILLALALSTSLIVGCIGAPPERVEQPDGTVLELSVDEQLAILNAEADAKRDAVVGAGEAIRPLLPPGADLALPVILAAILAFQERSRRQIAAKLKAKEESQKES